MANTAERVRSTKITIEPATIKALLRAAVGAPDIAHVELMDAAEPVYFAYALVEWDDDVETVDLRHVNVTG